MNNQKVQGYKARGNFTFHVLGFLLCFAFFNGLTLNAHSALNAKSDSSGITVELNLPELKTTTVEHNGIRYQTVSYDDSGFTNEAGNPRLPVSRVILGVPPDTNFRIEVQLATNKTQQGYRLLPVPHFVSQPRNSISTPNPVEEIQTPVEEWREDGPAYRTGGSYPHDLARIVYDGYLRSQRLIYLELHPVQYDARTRLLRIHPRMVVRVHFENQFSRPTPSYDQSSSSSQIYSAPIVQEPERFERTFQHLILNYDEAKRWRLPRGKNNRTPMAPAARQATTTMRYKILVDETGIYRLTSDDLRQKWGIELRDVDPRYLHLQRYDTARGNESQEIPIYVHGEGDGRFDRGDYIDFLGLDAKDRYTRWNVYWLSVEKTRGVRVSELNASPADPTATIVPVFRSKNHFEEDHLTSNLEHVHPEDVSPDDKHGWFEALDFWFWTGIKNSSDFDKKDLEFPLYDLAQSFAQPKIQVTLQGGTPANHEILVSLNDVRIGGKSAKWERQNFTTIERTLRVWDNLRDITKGDMNVMSLARVDTTSEDDTTRYPYHVYINSFDVEYTRLLKAVNDYLEFSSPASKESYSIRRRRKLEYTLQAFLSPDIEIFEYDGERLISKLQNPKIARVVLERAERDRLRAIFQSNVERGEDEEALEEIFDIPRIAYNATFQFPDTRNAKFIAVSSAGVREPVHVEAVLPSDLLSNSNGADYLIISHPVYFEPAQKLVAWRSTPKGGGFRAKVIDVTQIYNIFSNGMVNPQAIKEFLKYAYENWTSPALSYVAIMGDGTYDFRGIDEELYPEAPEVMGYIPTHYIWTSSFGRTSTDHWYTTVSGFDELPDFFIGRLSAETLDHANAIVDKIVNYERSRPNGNWRRQIISVADDEVNNSGDFIFKKSLTEIAQSRTLLGYETIKIFLEDVIDMVEANPQNFPGKLPQRVAKDMVIEALSQGGIIAQYAGHGGRIVWAHEAIFDNAAIDLLDQTDHLPFMLVLSCYNGYFDAPGEPSMAEKLLRKDRGGIIAMLSATRLTYGSGNDALNRIIFDDIFKRNERELGAISFNSKVELLMQEGLGQIDVMMAYTLFGDPAMKLAMADYEMQPKIETNTVAPGGTLRVAPGQIYEADYDSRLKQKTFTPFPNFNGKLQVKAIFPGKYKTVEGKEGPVEFYTGDVTVTEELSVTNGRFSGISITVPKEISAGTAHVEYYAENATHIAVGGESFTVLVPKILDVQPEVVTDTTFRISAQVSDELGDKGIKEVTLDWRNPIVRQWQTETMVPDSSRGEGWYTVSQPLPLSANGDTIRYQIVVVDTDGRRVESETLRFRPFVFPDLRVVDTASFSDEPLIYYRYSSEANAWTLNADIEQVEDVELKDSVEVAFFEGNPDLDEDNVVDADAKLIGQTQLRPTAWSRRNPLEPNENSTQSSSSPLRTYQEDPLNTNWIATATIQHELSMGNYELFVWVDAVWESDTSNQETTSVPRGKVREGDETDNISVRRIQVNGTLIGKGDVRAFSQDGVIDFRVPSSAIVQPAVLTITPLKVQEEGAGFNLALTGRQPSLKPIALPNGSDAAAYHVTLDDESPNLKLNQPIPVEIRFDLDALKASIRDELFGSVEEDSAFQPSIIALDPDQIAAINEGAEQRAQEIGAYLWIDTLGKWVRLDSELVTSANRLMQTQTVVANVRESNHGNGEIGNATVASTEATPGKRVLLFTSPNTYRSLIGKDGNPLEVLNPNETINQFQDSQNFSGGVSIEIEPGERAFQFGDVLTFQVAQSSSETNGGSSFYASSFREQNRGTGTIQYIRLASNSEMPADGWVILLVDSQRFQVEGQKTGILSRNNQPILGVVGEEFTYSEFGLTLKITSGKWNFEAGDSFRFETKEVGRIRAEIPMLGRTALMRSDDTIPPDIQLTIGRQNFVDGDPISPEPLIQATLGDDNGIDYITRPIRLEVSQDNREFKLIPETEYRLIHRTGANQVVLNYQSPKLEPGTYQFRLTASDLDGNESQQEIEARVHKLLQLLRAMNYPNPFKRETTITCELTGVADEMTVKIYSLSGRLIREFKEDASAGFMMMPWDGYDEDGEEVANGVYYCKIRVKMEGEKDLTEYIKMMKLK
ncbi:T9SS type A sorting domain-containing protein [Candidatus Poribacteria bacterium]|nr:T9SS type A sorting domain-containing protein [Candidatus Poribacteria bacterium]